jgi:hypothetical protein
LYVEYSPTNIRLTRCAKCGKVADKYIEYELLLVLLDAILHRKPAVRHLLYNRMNDSALVVSYSSLEPAVYSAELTKYRFCRGQYGGFRWDALQYTVR